MAVKSGKWLTAREIWGKKKHQILCFLDKQRACRDIVRIHNLISAIIREHPCEILLRGVSLSAPMNNTLRHIARIVVEQA